MLRNFRLPAVSIVCACLALPPEAFSQTHESPHDRPGAPEIVSRQTWGAGPPDLSLMTKQAPHGVVIHHTSVRQQPKRTLEQKLRGLQQFSQTPGQVGRKRKPAWGDVPYHYYIDAAGRIGEGRDIGYAGDTNTAYDPQDKVQIAAEGDFETEQPTAAQLQALRRLLAWLVEKYAIRPETITSHNDFAQTDCPGKNLKSVLPAIIRDLPRRREP